MSNDSEYGLIVRFHDQSHSYVHGFEAGIIWRRMESGEQDFSATIHDENIAVIRDMAAACGLSATINESEVEGWSYAEFSTLPTKKKLTLVQGGISASQQKREG